MIEFAGISNGYFMIIIIFPRRHWNNFRTLFLFVTDTQANIKINFDLFLMLDYHFIWDVLRTLSSQISSASIHYF